MLPWPCVSPLPTSRPGLSATSLPSPPLTPKYLSCLWGTSETAVWPTGPVRYPCFISDLHSPVAPSLEHTKLIPKSGSLHLLFPLWGTPFPALLPFLPTLTFPATREPRTSHTSTAVVCFLAVWLRRGRPHEGWVPVHYCLDPSAVSASPISDKH